MPAPLRREMGFSRADLLRCLREAFGASLSVIGDELAVLRPEGAVRVRLSDERERRIALLKLPLLEVEIDFGALDEAAAREFLERFDAYTRRGGG